jgi:hypothetical protein
MISCNTLGDHGKLHELFNVVCMATDWVTARISRGWHRDRRDSRKRYESHWSNKQKSMRFQHFPHTFSSYRFMITGIRSRPITHHEHRSWKWSRRERSRFWSVFILRIYTDRRRFVYRRWLVAWLVRSSAQKRLRMPACCSLTNR